MTALYAVSTPSRSASARSRPFAASVSRSFFAMPRNSSDRITPELPRAPRSSAEAVVSAAFASVGSLSFASSFIAAVMVIDIFVPVSPSGTGKTFSSLICSFCSVMASAPSVTMD